MFEFVTQHQFWAAVVIYWIFSAAVSSMPEPASNGKAGYLWLYRFLHSVAGNVTTAFLKAARYRAGASRSGKIPGLQTLFLILMVPVLLAASGCVARYPIHPGALNKADSAAYDVLLVAQSTIDQARAQYEAGALPASALEALNRLVEVYNIARESWLTYRSGRSLIDPDHLIRNLSDLTNAVRAFEKEAK